MITVNIKDVIDSDIHKVWEMTLNVSKYNTWRSDLSKTKIVSQNQFVEYTKKGYYTIFTVTLLQPYKRWEFDMENSNIKGHWIGVFTSKEDKTQVDFSEHITVKKKIMKPFVKLYLKKQQKQFIKDLKKILEKKI